MRLCASVSCAHVPWVSVLVDLSLAVPRYVLSANGRMSVCHCHRQRKTPSPEPTHWSLTAMPALYYLCATKRRLSLVLLGRRNALLMAPAFHCVFADAP